MGRGGGVHEPRLGIIKTSSPTSVEEPGDDVTFTSEIYNYSTVDSVTIKKPDGLDLRRPGRGWGLLRAAADRASRRVQLLFHDLRRRTRQRFRDDTVTATVVDDDESDPSTRAMTRR